MVGSSVLIRPPISAYLKLIKSRQGFLRDVFVIDPPIDLYIMSEQNILNKFSVISDCLQYFLVSVIPMLTEQEYYDSKSLEFQYIPKIAT